MAETHLPETPIAYVDGNYHPGEPDVHIPLLPEIPEAEHPAGIEMVEWIFTNDKTNEYTKLLFHGLYQGAFANKLGIMQAKVKDSDEIHTLIVGVELTDGLPNCYPLAKILTGEELNQYATPDGNGEFVS